MSRVSAVDAVGAGRFLPLFPPPPPPALSAACVPASRMTPRNHNEMKLSVLRWHNKSIRQNHETNCPLTPSEIEPSHLEMLARICLKESRALANT